MKIYAFSKLLTSISIGVALAALNASPSLADGGGGEHAHGDGVEADLARMGVKKLEATANPKVGLRRYSKNPAVRALVDGPPDSIGQWSRIINTPVIPIFTALLPNGKVLMWDTAVRNPTVGLYTRTVVWNPANNTFAIADEIGYNIFCAGFSHLADGRLLVAGGTLPTGGTTGIPQTHIFDFNTNQWSRGQDMAYSRWYPSVASLPNGEQFIMAGGPSTHEVYQTNGFIRILTTAVLAHTKLYPFIQTNVDGRVFYAGPDLPMRALNTAGTGLWQVFGNRDGIYRDYGSYAMYDIGKFLVAGGGLPPTKTARVINTNGIVPVSTATGSMTYLRRQHNLTILPDGTVLATGGLSSATALFNPDTGVYAAEVWNPATGTWKELASAQVTRQYHSVAMLLPDGRVMTGGGGLCGPCQAAGYLRKDVEIFSPPYLFKKDGSGQLAPRPTVSSFAPSIIYGQTLTINTPNAAAISKVAMIRLGAPTHSQDQGQRYIPLSFTSTSGQINATAPANANIAPPGYYMVFIIDSSGVPSVASMVRVKAVSTAFASRAVARHSNLCLNVTGAQIADGVILQQLSCNGSNAQNFQFRPVAGTSNTYSLVNFNSNKCATVQGASLDNGANIVQMTCAGNANNQFRLESVGDSYYKLIATHSNKCVAVNGGPTATGEGIKLVQWACTTNSNQQWQIAR
ncbi:MAG: RICIN domain-containing protein [Cyanosarcina radialis HA8281-LM2]|jgi:hypothetical protein|nr:RICIN domain-containing protein [Cyanosarcina radialis HA8281-LM2]